MSFGVAVIGYGRMGVIHSKNVFSHPKLKLSYIVGRNTEKAEALARQFPAEVKVAATLADGPLQDDEVKGVVIASATEAHYEQIIQTVNAGRHVFCEKPIALNADQIRDCFEAAERNGVRLLCGYQRRFDHSVARIKETIKSGLIGDVQLVRLTSRDHPPPPMDYMSADSTGSFFDDFSTHDVDLARFLIGEEPSHVYAAASTFLPGAQPLVAAGKKAPDDTAVIVLQFPSGAICAIDNSRHTLYGYDVRAEILGNKGMLTLENPFSSSMTIHKAGGVQQDVYPFSFPERFEQAYRSELDHWVELVEDKQLSPRVVLQDCLNAALLTRRCQESREQQTPSLPPAAKSEPAESQAAPYPRLPEGVAKLGVAIFGTGRMGRVRAVGLQKSPQPTEVLWGCDVYPPSAESFAAAFPGCQAARYPEDVDRVLQDERVQAVVICTTSSQHCELITRSLRAGKHVFCEKPLALNVRDTIECVDLAREKGLALYCGFHRRSDASFRRTKQEIYGQEGGAQIEFVKITSREPGSHSDIAYLQSSGGFLYDSLIHDLDMARWLVQDEVVEVHCVGKAFLPHMQEVGDIDAVIISLRFANGVLVTIDNHRNAEYGYDQRVEVHTARNTWQTGNMRNTTVTQLSKEGVTYDLPPPGMVRYAEAYEEEIQHFVRLLFGIDKEARSIPSDCLKSAILADAATESQKTGKTVIIQ